MKAPAAPILGLIVVTSATVLVPRAVNCNGRSFDLTVDNWNKLKVDESIRAFWQGGTDAEGVEWPGAESYRQPKEFTTLLGRKLQNKGAWTCSGLPFDASCDAEPCSEIGRYNKAGKMNGIGIGQEAASEYASQIALDFVKPKEEPKLWFKDLFAAAAAAFGILGALPAASCQPWVSGANAVAGLIGTEVGLHLKGPTEERNFQTASTFALAIEQFSKQARESLEVANNLILNSANDATLNVIAGGQWINAPGFTQTDIAEFYKRNMIARGINAIWRQYPVYVYYVWLDDAGAKPGDKGTKCDLDRSGPQALKYCADDGVYYLYMYNGRGVDWPWGGPKLADKPYSINPIWAIESSARSFKASGINYDPSKTDTSRFLGSANIADYITSPERLEGTWTLPICDGSSRKGFNIDYLNQRKVDLKDGVGMPPCACGIDGRDTATFVKAANLDPKKMARMCFDAWVRGGTETWPAGVEGIAYGEDGKNSITKGAIDGCRRGSGESNPSHCTELN
ncbi:MAG: hypothetical protein L6R42_003652 [Xanthoria sp. 1 TBL-2021]|nr:MAG: hypothetical protein L6R42_003652 [Xanthoria sp. 1 TBL-2021]